MFTPAPDLPPELTPDLVFALAAQISGDWASVDAADAWTLRALRLIAGPHARPELTAAGVAAVGAALAPLRPLVEAYLFAADMAANEVGAAA